MHKTKNEIGGNKEEKKSDAFRNEKKKKKNAKNEKNVNRKG